METIRTRSFSMTNEDAPVTPQEEIAPETPKRMYDAVARATFFDRKTEMSFNDAGFLLTRTRPARNPSSSPHEENSSEHEQWLLDIKSDQGLAEEACRICEDAHEELVRFWSLEDAAGHTRKALRRPRF